MNRTLLVAVFLFASVATRGRAAEAGHPPDVNIAISGGSLQIDGIELRRDPPRDSQRYLSRPEAEKALGKPLDNYHTSPSVRLFGWPDRGIQMLQGLRGVEKGKIFKFQVWFTDYYDKANKKHSGICPGHVHLDGADIGPDTTFDQIREALQKNGWAVGDYSGTKSANKGEISIFTVGGASDKIERVELWCRN